MKIAIFENEYDSVKGAFNAANTIKFDDKLELINFPSSQNAVLSDIANFDVIFIDIDLSSRSDLDGYSLIERLKSVNSNIIDRIVILTGNNNIVEALKSRKIDYSKIDIIIKPSDYIEIATAITKKTKK